MQERSLSHRFFWSWDHSTNWALHAYGAQNCGVANAYAKAPGMLLVDYCRVVDFCAAHKIGAVGIAGLFREKHGGVDAVRRLCDYANSKGVRIYQIAGLFAYGGIFYEGDHPYSMNRFFEKNPDCIARTADGEKFYCQFDGRHGYNLEPQGCPSNEKLHEFVLESLDWLFRDVPELGGIQIEAGDNGVCQCPRCRARRGKGTGSISASDMAGIYPEAVATILRQSPDALVICEAYRHFTYSAFDIFRAENPTKDVQALFDMPDKVFWQWRCDDELENDTWKMGEPMIPGLQKFNHVMRAHSGTQWREGRGTFDVDKIRRQCLLSSESGLNGVSIFGEYAPFHTNAELNYLALEYFADHPHAPMDAFIRDVMAPLLGGEEYAHIYYDAARMHMDPSNVPEFAVKAAKIMSGITDYEILRRWQYIASFLNGFYWEAQQTHQL